MWNFVICCVGKAYRAVVVGKGVGVGSSLRRGRLLSPLLSTTQSDAQPWARCRWVAPAILPGKPSAQQL